VLIAGPEAFVAHVGDSRTYLLRAGKTAQVTTDHTVAEVLLIEGKLSPEEAQVSPLRTILVNAIGVADDVGVEMAHVRLRTGDQLLISSDGLHDYFPSEEELASQLAGKPEDILARMIDLVRERGGHDNITGVVIQVLDTAEDHAAADPGDLDAVPQPVARGDTLPFGEAITPPAGQAAIRGPRAGGAGAGASAGEAGSDADESDESKRGAAKASPNAAEDAGAKATDAEAGGDENAAAAEGASDGSEAKGKAKAKPKPTAKQGEGPGHVGTNGAPAASADVKPGSDEAELGESDDEDSYVEDDTLVGYDPDAVKPPAPKPESGESADAGESERRDPEKDA
jgi:hypothetical protein